MKKLSHFTGGLFIASLLLTGAGCPSIAPTPDIPPDDTFTYDDSDFAVDYFETTGHGSRVSIHGIDEALVGTWQLQSVYVAGGQVKSPFAGSTMTYSTDGSLTQDYSTEQYSGGAVAVADCEISGASISNGFTEVDYIYITDDVGNIIDATPITNLKIYDKSGTAKVECTGPSGQTIGSAHQSAELGTGQTESDATGYHVPYYYEMNENWSTLTLWLGEPDDGFYTAKYTFTRLTGPYPFQDDYDGS